ncbi:MAG: hypothetical protein AAF065_01730 [Verrucomicrobiota bacterium]
MSCSLKPNTKSSSCSTGVPDLATLDSYESVVAHYTVHQAPIHEAELEKISDNTNSLEELIYNAATAKCKDTKRHPHQRRLKKKDLEEAAKRLQKVVSEIGFAKDFEGIYQIFKRDISSIKGIGELTAYDTALRISHIHGCLPERVYLHAGALKGAKHIETAGHLRKGVSSKDGILDVDDFPSAFRKLKGYQLENCLCIYKDVLKRISLKKKAST